MKKLIFAFICLFLAIPLQARIITVDDDGPADFSNIQAAISDSNDDDTIIVAPGTYTGTGNRNIDFTGKAITVRSSDPNDPNIVAATIINCQQWVRWKLWRWDILFPK
jgi:pectin methylesterase-like acyl-CoA thioesterase